MSTKKKAASRGLDPELGAAMDRLENATTRAAGFCTKTPECPYCEVGHAVKDLRAILKRRATSNVSETNPSEPMKLPIREPGDMR